MNIKKDILWRVYVVYGLICLFGFIIIVKAVSVRYFETTDDGRTWMEYDQEVRKTKKEKKIEPLRGTLFSEDGRVLATSYPLFEIRFDALAPSDKDFNENIDSLSIVLAGYFGRRSAEAWKDKLQNARIEKQRYVLLGRRVTLPELKKVKKFPLLEKGAFKGGRIIIQQNRRIKPFENLAHRTIGYVRPDVYKDSKLVERGFKVGLEGYYDSLLAGKEGLRWEKKVAGGKWMPLGDENIVDPIQGADVYTTLDAYIQDIAHAALEKAVTKHKADHGSVVVMEVATGKIKAVSNLAITENENYFESFNFAIGEGTAPGSTMKLMSSLALLEDGFMTLEDSVDIGDGTATFYERVLHESDKKAHGWVDFRTAFATSSNIFYARAIDSAFRDRPHEYIKYIKRTGFHRPTGIDIKGESMPFIKDPANRDHKDARSWTGITLPWMAIGYELEVTPLQMLAFYNAVANDGKMMKPYLVSQIKQGNDVVYEEEGRVIVNSICSDKTLKDLQELTKLPPIHEKGTARSLRNPYFPIAGKTSTAKIKGKKGTYGKVYQSSFAGYFPADNPLYTCIVVVNAPKQYGYYGATVAGPVFKEIAEKVYSRKILAEHDLDTKSYDEHHPYVKWGNVSDVQELCSEYEIDCQMSTNKEWVKVREEEGKVYIQDREIVEDFVPNVIDLGLKDAVYLLENSGLKVKITGKGIGKVRKQSVRPGAKIRTGLIIEIEVS